MDPHIRECVHACFLGDTSQEGNSGSGSGSSKERVSSTTVLGKEEETSAVNALRRQCLQVLNILAGSDRASEALGALCMRYWDTLNQRMGVTNENTTHANKEASAVPSSLLAVRTNKATRTWQATYL